MMFFLAKKHRSSCDQEASPSFNLDVKRSKNIKSSLLRMVTRCKNRQSPAELGASRAPQAPEVCLKQSSVLLDCRLLHRLSHGAPKGRSRFLWKSGGGGSICKQQRVGLEPFDSFRFKLKRRAWFLVLRTWSECE